MCELKHLYSKFQTIYHYWQNGRIPQKLLQNLNKKPEYGKCQKCGRSLSHTEMHPPGRCSRSMCQSCYNNEAANNPDRQTCMVCGEWLPSHQFDSIRNNPRELCYHVCNGNEERGECFEYLVARHTATVCQGSYPEFNSLPSLNSSSLSSFSSLPPFNEAVPENINFNSTALQSSQEDILDAEYEDITPNALPSGQKSLGPAVEQQLIRDLFKDPIIRDRAKELILKQNK